MERKYVENRWFNRENVETPVRDALERYRPLIAASGKSGSVDLGLTLYNIHVAFRFLTYEESLNLLAFIHGVSMDDGRLLTTKRYVKGQKVHAKIVEKLDTQPALR